MMRRALTYLAIVGLLPLAAVSGPVHSRALHATPRTTLRVGLGTLRHDREIEVTPVGAATLRACERCRPLALPRSIVVRVDHEALSYTVGTGTARAKELLIAGPVRIAAPGESLRLDLPLSFRARDDGLVAAVTLPVERYVERVVASESGPADTPESLKALAIVVRSYALHERHGHPDYDLCDSTHCQLLRWSGADRGLPRAHRAALETAGETLWFQGQPAQAYFNKDCGGRSAPVNEVWPRAAPRQYLDSRPDPYCTGTPGSRWATELTRAELTAALARSGLAAPGWRQLTVDRRSPSGRVIALRADGTLIPAEEFRIAVGEALGWNRVRSSWFELTRDGERYLFAGRGTGHGVGLCQTGAAVMGARGSSAAEILAQYLPGAYAADEATGGRWTELRAGGLELETLEAADAALLPVLEQARAEASARSGLKSGPNGGRSIRVRAFPSVEAFRDGTLAPGWVAAFTEGEWIAIQPLRILAGRHLLEGTLRHEFLHALVEGEAGPGAPLWLREGLVEAWNGEAAGSLPAIPRPAEDPGALEAALARPDSGEQAAAAHREAGIRVRRLLDRYGRERVLGWLRSGVPGDVLAGAGIR